MTQLFARGFAGLAATLAAAPALAHDGHDHALVIGGEAHRMFGVELSWLLVGVLALAVGAGVAAWRARKR